MYEKHSKGYYQYTKPPFFYQDYCKVKQVTSEPQVPSLHRIYEDHDHYPGYIGSYEAHNAAEAFKKFVGNMNATRADHSEKRDRAYLVVSVPPDPISIPLIYKFRMKWEKPRYGSYVVA